MTWTVLNIDDDEAGRYSVTRLLKREGFTVLDAATAREGMNLARSQDVDLIVLDVNLPDANGMDVCKELKAGEGTSAIPVLIMSASYLDVDDQVRGLEFGADGYLTEPVEPEIFVAHVKALLRMRQAERSLEKARQDAESASLAKDRFLAILSHELRTPLNPIMGAIELLSSMGLSPDAQEMVDIISRNAQLETRLIDDLLDITRIEQGKLRVKFEPVDVHALISEVASTFQQAIEAKHLNLEVSLAAIEFIVSADAARMQQVIRNLLTNAIKFTPEQEKIAITTKTEESGRITVRVVDTGIGIDEEQLKSIFTAFDQGPDRTNQTFGGLGLGLAICCGIIETHGGKLRAESPGRGSGSSFIIELDTVAEPPPAEHGNRQTAGVPRPLRILVVDDHADTAMTLKMLLERRGFTVVTATSVGGAVVAAAESSFDLLVTDIGLPDGTGHELMLRLGSEYGFKGIAVSGYGMESDIDASRRAGFCAHITKPINIDDLVNAIAAASCE